LRKVLSSAKRRTRVHQTLRAGSQAQTAKCAVVTTHGGADVAPLDRTLEKMGQRNRGPVCIAYTSLRAWTTCACTERFDQLGMDFSE
jgi:hypothetical protein